MPSTARRPIPCRSSLPTPGGRPRHPGCRRWNQDHGHRNRVRHRRTQADAAQHRRQALSDGRTEPAPGKARPPLSRQPRPDCAFLALYSDGVTPARKKITQMRDRTRVEDVAVVRRRLDSEHCRWAGGSREIGRIRWAWRRLIRPLHRAGKDSGAQAASNSMACLMGAHRGAGEALSGVPCIRFLIRSIAWHAGTRRRPAAGQSVCRRVASCRGYAPCARAGPARYTGRAPARATSSPRRVSKDEPRMSALSQAGNRILKRRSGFPVH